MISKWKWYLLAFARKLWVRATLYAGVGVIVTIFAWLVQGLVPDKLASAVGDGTVESLLQILASSMLSVTTFALGIMVSALANAASNVTPRATLLLMQDGTTHNVLSTFVGSFLFSLVGIIALKAGIYHDAGRLVLFIATIAMVAVIVIALLRWIAHLTEFGRLPDSLRRVESATRAAVERRLENPWLGCNPLRGPVPAGAWPVRASRIGYVQHLATGALSDRAEGAGVTLYLAAVPGSFVAPGAPLLWVLGPRVEGLEADLAEAYTLGDMRSFDQDPRFGMSVLAEVASRALSPAVNDPGTAIDVIGRGVRLLTLWAHHEAGALAYPRIWVPGIAIADLFEDFFRPIARDGAAMVEVHMRLQKGLHALASFDRSFAAAALAQSREAMARAEVALVVDSDRDVLRRLTAEVAERAGPVRPPPPQH